MYYNPMQALENIIQDDLEEAGRYLRSESQKRKRVAAQNLKTIQDNIRNQRLRNEHTASVKLADTAYSLSQQVTVEMRKIDRLIKQAKQERQACRVNRDFIRADTITRLIALLADIYHDLQTERDSLRTRTQELNANTATLRKTICSGNQKRLN